MSETGLDKWPFVHQNHSILQELDHKGQNWPLKKCWESHRSASGPLAYGNRSHGIRGDPSR